ncbi:beta-galactosidase-1-like protein 2 isoform X2 [Gambusia affinis]|uniref:beta-galactosidase-1-like protein 2 isoform X2 n=1 Tax=Gambusia affinis TaxID=33528 RepID=UPI001CDC6A43|nr:beta-galactosidase-1-like protein 2 isoform X2 [Gambusia affinis]
MGVLRTRTKQKQIHAFICLCIVGFIFYKYLGFFQSSSQTDLKKMRKMGLNTNLSQFTLDGKPFFILGGSVHYFRVPRPYWRDRLLKMMACGINTLTTHVPWSLHQPEKGVFNFHTQLDLEAFISLAAELGLWVILCPGPYISADMDLGGLPSWLLRDDSMRLRTTHPGFIQAVNTYFDKLIPKVVPFQFHKGGPIIAVQIENEYGSFAKDEKYMLFIKEALWSRGIREVLLTSDKSNSFKLGGVVGALRAVKLRKMNQRIIQELNSVKPNKPFLVMEYWTGWYDTWGELHHVLPPEDTVSTVRNILRRGMSVNLHMFHGGSSFGFMNGADSDLSYKALVSSYDYDAPLSEAGGYTAKYHLLRDLFSQFRQGNSLPDMPKLRYSDSYETAIMYQHLSLWDALSFTESPFTSSKPVNMENLPANNGNGQSYGYTLYETTITSGGILQSGDNVRDCALVYVDKKYIGLLKRKILELAVPDGKEERTLSFLVENRGRVHRGRNLDKQRKGLVGDILFNGIPLRGFTTYSLDMKFDFIESLNQASWKNLPETPSFPGFFMGRVFVYSYPSDTFVKLPGWGKGVVFINSLNLGRYWSVGPQQSLYLPGPFLHSGVNQIVVFEEMEGDYYVHFEDSPDLGMEVEID